MSHNSVILLLGTNLGDKESNLKTCKKLIEQHFGEIVDFSEVIETEAEDFESEHLFFNQTLKINTEYSPIKVLKLIKKIEVEMGRVYSKPEQRYQDRLIDIDLLYYNKITFESQILRIPHPQVFSRNFIKKILNYGLDI